MESDKSMEVYLEPTTLCDFTHPTIISKAKELTKNNSTLKEMALSIFHFVRDDIRYLMNYADNKASDTLALKFGDCGTKTNLQVALLRAVNIPARYHIAALRKECIKGIVSPLFYRLTPKIIQSHPWCECFLSGKWIMCDTLFDKTLVEVLHKKGIITHQDIPTIEWDGEYDLNTMTEWIVEDKGIISSLEELLTDNEQFKNPLEALVTFICKRSNKYTDRLRNFQ
jgi:transglutaminase-like putative cysteine protease